MNCTKEDMLLYAVTDRAWTGEKTLIEQVKEALDGGITFLQLREKELGEEEFLRAAKDMKALAAAYHVPFIINDNVELALAVGADGVHVGQEDMEAGKAREKLGPDKIIGVSAHSVEEAIEAEKNGADYLGAGAVFSTSTKGDAGALSMETLKAICSSVSIPVVASYRRNQGREYLISEGNRSGRSCYCFRNFCSEKYQRGLCPATQSGKGNGGGMKNMDIEGAIFDVDGTLLDSMGYWEHLGDEYLLSRQIQPPENLANLLASMTLLEAAEYFKKHYGITDEAEEMIKDFDQLMAGHYREEIPEKEGVRQVLEDLQERQIPMYIATATQRPMVEAALKRTGLDRYFQGMITCQEAGESKRNPLIYQIARERLGTKKEKTAVFEDAVFAAQTAKKDGFFLVGIYDIWEPQPELLKKTADIYLKTWSEWK